jgi:hypothetical protein
MAGKTASEDGRFAVRDGILVISGSKDTPPKVTTIDTVDSYEGDSRSGILHPALGEGVVFG